MSRISSAKMILDKVRGSVLSNELRKSLAIELAGLIIDEANASQTHEEKKSQAELARMMDDPNGKLFFTSMTDQCFRSKNSPRIANQIVYLLQKFGIPQFLGFSKRVSLFAFRAIGNIVPYVLTPLAKHMIHKETKRVILPGDPYHLKKHMQRRREEGVKINLNHLGEAILGEGEADRRLQLYLEDLKNPDISYISVKISTIYSQINALAWEETLEGIAKRLRLLYRAALANPFTTHESSLVSKFVNLDMEEYRDLHLTVEVFQQVLNEPEFLHLSAGIVLQSYLPDSYAIQQKLTKWAQERVKQHGAPIKIRIVKGANLAMEKVEASLRGWEQAPYEFKIETDANYKRMLLFGCLQDNAIAARIGVGSHNIFDIAYALLLRAENQVDTYVSFEMLEGMADHMRRAVQKLSGDMLLYCPSATLEEFQNAVAYLVRRLDENTAPENFLRHSFNLKVGSEEWQEQVDLFSRACEMSNVVSSAPRRTQSRLSKESYSPANLEFSNEPDTDWTLFTNLQWAKNIIRDWRHRKHSPIPLVIGSEHLFNENSSGIGEDPAFPGKILYKYALATESHIDHALNVAKQAQQQWASVSVEDRSKLLAEVANELRKSRADLIGAMLADGGKTIPESDVEVSEAVDFAEYYRQNLEEITCLEDIEWHAKGTVLVAPPWNFPCSIPAGCILGALAAGNCVIFKPARESSLVGWWLVQIFWKAGISKNVLQFITCEDDPVGSRLIRDPRVDCVLLTGGTETAKLMLKMRPGLDLIGETGGKNSIIITNMSDRDLAIKDLIHSAFGHGGQKCSACSLAICEAEVYDDPHFFRQLKDAASSLKVGIQWDPSTKVNPLIHAPHAILMRGLTTLEAGEQWLLEPKQDPINPNLWSPGIKLGVLPGSFTYKNELFGPVLSVMRANNLKHALDLANGTQYGLTAGLHSLDDREQRIWIKNILAGNCYINRGITGAIVQRQPFGGCKESSFGPGVKAGGPNYVMQLMRPKQIALPEHTLSIEYCGREVSDLIKYLTNNKICNNTETIVAAAGSYAFFWHHYFSKKMDPSGILGEDNLFYYVPQRQMVFRVMPEDSILDIILVAMAAAICKTKLVISSPDLLPIKKNSHHLKFIMESEEQLIKRIQDGEVKRLRILSKPEGALALAMAKAACNISSSPVIYNGRIELLKYLREVSLSFDYHRYGYLGEREFQESKRCLSTQCCGGGCR